jgi:hypothetical protein
LWILVKPWYWGWRSLSARVDLNVHLSSHCLTKPPRRFRREQFAFWQINRLSIARLMIRRIRGCSRCFVEHEKSDDELAVLNFMARNLILGIFRSLAPRLTRWLARLAVPSFVNSDVDFPNLVPTSHKNSPSRHLSAALPAAANADLSPVRLEVTSKHEAGLTTREVGLAQPFF